MTANPLRFQASIVRKKRRFALELFDGHVARCHSRCVFRLLLLSSRGCLFYRLTHTGRTAFISKFRVAAGLDYEALLQSFVTTGRESCFFGFFPAWIDRSIKNGSCLFCNNICNHGEDPVFGCEDMIWR